MNRLDRIDIEIVRQLQKNARLSNKELAAAAGIAQSTCLERVRRLVASGVFTGFHGIADPASLGVGIQALVSIRLQRHSRSHVSAFRDYALSLPEVVALHHVTGGSDFQLHVVARDTEHLRELTLTAFTTRPEVVRLETALIFEAVRKQELPIYLELEE